MSDDFIWIGGSIQSISVAGTNSSSTSQITVPADVKAGDILVVFNRSGGPSTPSTVVPSGFTAISNAANSNYRLILSYKLANGSEGGTTLNGMSALTTANLFIGVFRPNIPARVLTLGSVDAGLSAGSQTRTTNSGSSTPPLVVVAGWGANTTIGGGDWSMSPSADGSLTASSAAFRWKIYNRGTTPSNVTATLSAISAHNGVQITHIVPSLN